MRETIKMEKEPRTKRTSTRTLKKNSVFWDIMPYSPGKLDRRFGGTYRFHLQERGIKKTQEVGSKESLKM
jgi:hypothetical protein